MDKEVDPAVLAVINEKRLTGEKRTPVEIIARMGVFDARQKASDHAWLATGDIVIATIWAEFVSVGSGGQWFYLESLDPHHKVGGGTRSDLQIQRAKDRLALLKRTMDAGLGLRTVLQTNRVAIQDIETDRAAKVSTRVPDDQEWHIAAWDPPQKIAVLVRGARGWVPSDEEVASARARGSVPAAPADGPSGQASAEDAQAAAMAYLTRHFAGYGYKAENVSDQKLGYDIEVSDKKGATLLKLAVKGTTTGVTTYRLTGEERACAKRGDPWRLAVVTDAIGPAAQHKLYKPSEVDKAPGLEPLLD
ncbi:protein NO VEIN domain-containing protein [Variovorax sp. GT1P44]|uniref:protein NO VEIN domain-containing protein n=1 Tax=Variovorax sp. GT1P44 TaxID=3443742 RepID=UPI003F465DB8